VINASNLRESFLNGCKWKQEFKSVSAAYHFQFPDTGRHEIRYLAEWRRLFDVQSGASHVIRDQAGLSLKSSLIHSWSKSTRDDAMLPSNGQLVKLTNELAGVGGSGDYSFWKADCLLQNNWTPKLIPSFPITLSQSCRLGHILPFGQTHSAPLQDRFFMGGPTSIRGFLLNSLGPREFSDSLGGTALAEIGFQVSFPFLQRAAHFARAHLFVNAGVLGEPNVNALMCDAWQSIKSKVVSQSLLNHFVSGSQNLNVSAGAGFVFKMADSARLELNFAVPILKQANMHVERGIQVGIGMEFL
jgi:outer membrane protein insertion porin family